MAKKIIIWSLVGVAVITILLFTVFLGRITKFGVTGNAVNVPSIKESDSPAPTKKCHEYSTQPSNFKPLFKVNFLKASL